MRHILVILAVIFAVIDNGWAQNRGSSRYTPPEQFDEDITRAPRPTRGAAVRRQRITTKAPEPAVVEDEVYQPADNPVRTTGRRVPQRGSLQQVAPPPPLPLQPAHDAAPHFDLPAEELSPAAPAAPESKPPGTRRRRPKKRRRPQNALPKSTEEPEKQIPVSNGEKTSISDLLNEDKKRTGVFQNDLSSRNSLPTYNSDSVYPPEKSQWESKQPPELQNNAAGPQYYEPQPAINRLPMADSDPLDNSRGYLESSPAVPVADAPAPFMPPTIPKDTSYVPILNPVRRPSEGSSRLPHENYPTIQNKDSTRLSSHPNVPLRGHGNRSPISTPEEIVRGKPVQNIIPQTDELSVPVRGHSEVRLPENQPPLSSSYDSSNFDSSEDFSAPIATVSEDVKDPNNPSNRLPNPSEIHYDSTYPEFSTDLVRGSQRAAGRRQELEEPVVRNPVPSYNTPSRDSGTTPHVYDNDAEVDRRQVSQYRPPLQRAGSRFKVEDSDKPAERSEEFVQSQPVANSRTRSSSRYQPPTDEYVPERTRTRVQTEPKTDSPTRSRSSSPSQSSTRTRGSQRLASDAVEPMKRTTARKPAVDDENILRNNPTTGYIPVEEFIKNEEESERTLLPSSRSRSLSSAAAKELSDIGGLSDTLRSRPQHSATEKELSDIGGLRGTLRSRPQYEVRDSDPTDRFEESVEEPNIYRPHNPYTHQPNARARLNQAEPYPSEPARQPAYQLPSNRQQNGEEFHYEPPQNHRTRQQSQFRAPQNPRTDSRHINNRENLQGSGIQARSRHQSEAPAASPRSSAGRNNFKCPDAFGFFADPVQCDKYYECRNGTAEMQVCNDGLAFNEISAPKFLRCDSLRDVDCSSRPELQEPQPTKNCPRRFGLFSHETDCTKFWNCVDGVGTEVQCPPGLTYNDERATCDWADLVETSCKSEDLLGFACPEPTAHDLLDGVYAKYPHPDNCQLHFICIKGADGLRRPRMLSCNEGLVFDQAALTCKRPEEVPGCENFYGGRSQAQKKKVADRREPEPISEEIVEEPTPRPRRRGTNRRVRT